MQIVHCQTINQVMGTKTKRHLWLILWGSCILFNPKSSLVTKMRQWVPRCPQSKFEIMMEWRFAKNLKLGVPLF